MIVLDIETSGLFPEKDGIWQIGAIDLETTEEFIEECRIEDDDQIEEEALKIIGKTEEELRDENKQSQKELLNKFLKWVGQRKIKNFLCQNPQFDICFIALKARKYGLEIPFHHRAFDLHSIAHSKYFEINGDFLIKEDHSDMGLSKILKFCGLEDERIWVEEGEVKKEGKPHNALEDARLTAECFSRILKGKNMFPEFAKFEIPQELKK